MFESLFFLQVRTHCVFMFVCCCFSGTEHFLEERNSVSGEKLPSISLKIVITYCGFSTFDRHWTSSSISGTFTRDCILTFNIFTPWCCVKQDCLPLTKNWEEPKHFFFFNFYMVSCVAVTLSSFSVLLQDGSFLLLGAPGLNDWTGIHFSKWLILIFLCVC